MHGGGSGTGLKDKVERRDLPPPASLGAGACGKPQTRANDRLRRATSSAAGWSVGTHRKLEDDDQPRRRRRLRPTRVAHRPNAEAVYGGKNGRTKARLEVGSQPVRARRTALTEDRPAAKNRSPSAFDVRHRYPLAIGNLISIFRVETEQLDCARASPPPPPPPPLRSATVQFIPRAS
jgi:hypothetical protein